MREEERSGKKLMKLSCGGRLGRRGKHMGRCDGKRASHRLGGRQGKVDTSCDLVFVNSD